MQDVFIFLYQYADAFALLALAAIGLIIIFGMMGIINMAHGELMMIGAFGAAYSHHAGAPLVLAILAGGLAAMLVGLILERLVIRYLYGRLLYSLVATWGISLILSQGALIVLGPSVQGIPTNFGNFFIGELSFSVYRMLLFGIAVLLIFLLWALFRFTTFGIQARATMSRPDMARALGANTTEIYILTFGLGSFLAGISGALFSLAAPVQPSFGASYTPIAFVVVVVAGSRNIIVGLVVSCLILAFIKTAFTINVNILTGYVAMLLAALLVIRATPNGISEALARAKWLLPRRSALRQAGR
ncbi:MAG: branched-chain amino acid ABC transporter permease [Parvibaculaceae bacterium]